MELNKLDKEIDTLLNIVYDTIKKINMLPELEINYNADELIRDLCFEGNSGLFGKIKTNLQVKKTLESIFFTYEKLIGEAGFIGRGIRNHIVSKSSLDRVKDEINNIENKYDVVVKNLEEIAKNLNSGNEDYDYKGAMSQIIANTGELEYGEFYFKIPLNAIIRYTDNVKKVLEKGVELGAAELKQIYEDFEKRLKSVNNLRRYALRHPQHKGNITLDTINKILKYEAGLIKKEG